MEVAVSRLAVPVVLLAALLVQISSAASSFADDTRPDPGAAQDAGSAEKAGVAENAGVETIVLASGNRIEGRVVKTTTETLFVDVGYTILSIPRNEVARVESPAILVPVGGAGDGGAPASSNGSRASNGSTDATGAEKDSIFFTARLAPGSIKDKAREVGESVVQVLTLSGSGSGFVIDDVEGYIVTNYHVIEREREIAVEIYVREDGGLRKQKVEGVEIVALNPFFDLALLKLAEPSKVPLRKSYLGDYERVRAGDPVFAIGNPLGLDRTVSDGIISNRSRALGGQLSIQTTAAINPGNSGGPLFNNRGEVVGVTSSKIVGGESLGFAIPVHYVKDFLRHKEAYAFDKDNPNTGVRYLPPPPKPRRRDGVAESPVIAEPARDDSTAGAPKKKI